MNIKTSYDRPPIPTTAADWSAWDADTSDGAEDSGTLAHIVGRGPTERAALIDLMEQTVDYWQNQAYAEGRRDEAEMRDLELCDCTATTGCCHRSLQNGDSCRVRCGLLNPRTRQGGGMNQTGGSEAK